MMLRGNDRKAEIGSAVRRGAAVYLFSTQETRQRSLA